TYLSDDSQPLTASSIAKVASQEEIVTNLNRLKKKKTKINLQNPSFTKLTSNKTTLNFVEPTYQKLFPVPCISQFYKDSDAFVCDNQPFFPDLINIKQAKPDTNKKCMTKPL
ncbi:19973_t:CDS:2, partial [Gigaspora rosea]